MDAAAISQKHIVKSIGTTTSQLFFLICEIIIMQRPGYNPGYPGPGGMNNGMPMQPGPPNAPGFHNPGGPVYAPGYGQPIGGPQQPQQNFQPNAGCFMPAAAIRKISNTTPPQQFNPSFQ